MVVVFFGNICYIYVSCDVLGLLNFHCILFAVIIDFHQLLVLFCSPHHLVVAFVLRFSSLFSVSFSLYVRMGCTFLSFLVVCVPFV